jgi:hypothetical protein
MISLRLLGSTVLSAALVMAPIVLIPSSPADAQIGIGIGVGPIGVGFHISVAPPPLPVYVQPPIPAPGYLWTPGYWAYGDAGYYWVPGTWVQPPSVGLLWTPGYWGWHGGFYGWNAGYWGPHVGFYGGINYGFGYGGIGFAGGFWRGGVFSYNAGFNNFGGAHFANVYNSTNVNINRTVTNNITNNITNTHTTVNNTSFNGPGGVTAQPTAEEKSFAAEQHVAPTPVQTQHEQTAAANPALRASVNHGAPAIAATQRPGEFRGANVVGARGAPPEAVAAARAGTLEHNPSLATPRTAAAATGAHPAMEHPGVTRPEGPHQSAALPKVNSPSVPGRPNYLASHAPAGARAANARPGGFGGGAQHAAFAPRPAPARPAPHPAPHGGGGGGGHHH